MTSSRPSFETRAADWLPVEEAQRRILADVPPPVPESVDARDALGRALAEDLYAPVTLPPWDNSAMDGYAVRRADVAGATGDAPVRLRVLGHVRAGEEARAPLEPGGAVRIMTGAPVPRGADSVVRVEDTDAEERGDGTVRIRSARDALSNIRPAGEDMKKGEAVLGRGATLGPGQIGLLAALGREEVTVGRPPRVAVLSTGDELIPRERYGDVRSGHGIPDTNGPFLSAALRAAGAVPLGLGIARDERESVLRRVSRARQEADVLVTTGGASMGEADILKRVLDEEGFELDFWRIRVRPGTPTSFGRLPATDGRPPLPIFGLPGNPASAFVTFQILVRPYLLRRAGHARIHLPRLRARAGQALSSPARLTHFFRVRLEDDGREWIAHLTGPQGSGLVRSSAEAEGLAVVREGVETVRAGEAVDVILLGDGPGWSRTSEVGA